MTQILPHLKFKRYRYIHYYVNYQNHQLHKQYNKETFLKNIHKDQYQLPIKHPLLPYQETGMMHLAFTERALLADEMGLGKTVQAIAACALLQHLQGAQRVLVIAPASLKTEWEEQIAKFTDLSSLIIYGTRSKRLIQYQQPAFFYLMNYEQVVSDHAEIQSLLAPDIIILDEAQRIKNWRTKTANAVKELKSRYAFVLTGTPVENRIDDIYSITQFLDPHIFGSLFRFNRDFYQLDDQGQPAGYKNLNALYHRLRPVMLCRKKTDVEGELPKLLNNNFFIKMTAEQRLRYEEYETRVARLIQQASRRPLRKEEFEKLQRWLACMRMLCDTPFILDKDCRVSPKLDELTVIVAELLEEPTTKIIIFSEWERMLQLVKEMAQEHGWQFAWHTGSVLQHKRREEIRQFKNNKDCRLFLSTDSGSVGLNLQTANVVINLDLPWNPAKLDQRIARAWRKHQLRPVQVINLICENSIEHRMLYLLEEKKRMAEGVLTGDESLSSMKMPSGRVALMERIQSLMEVEPQIYENKTSNKIVPPSSDNPLKQAALDTLGDSLLLLHTYVDKENQKPVVLAVVENLADDAQHQLSSKIESSLTLETIDQATLAIIQRLAQAGILTLHTPTSVLHDQDSPDQQQQRHKKHLKQIQESLDLSKKKQRMVRVLIESDFFEEALPPLHEAFKHSLQAFSLLKPLMLETTEIKTLAEQCEQLSVHLEKSRDTQSLHDEHQKVLTYLMEIQKAFE